MEEVVPVYINRIRENDEQKTALMKVAIAHQFLRTSMSQPRTDVDAPQDTIGSSPSNGPLPPSMPFTSTFEKRKKEIRFM